jgi:hypothetical protein
VGIYYASKEATATVWFDQTERQSGAMLRWENHSMRSSKRFWRLGGLRRGLDLLAATFILGSLSSVVFGGAAPVKDRSSGQKAKAATALGTKRIIGLKLVPADMTLWSAKASQRFMVIGQFADGVERDVTSESRLSISNPGTVKLGEHNRLRAVADGEAALKAVVDGFSAVARVRIEGSQENRPISFQQDIGGILTRNGCNNSSCHGSPKGKGGFKLSLNAIYPREDYTGIVEGGTYQVLVAEAKGPKVPRINLEEPTKSLFLLKPTLTAPHGGGERFKVGSSDYEKILSWIRAGAPYGQQGAQGLEITKIEVFPKEAVLDLGGSHHLLVTGYLSNGQQQDLTDEARYISNNPDVVKVSSSGLVQPTTKGETVILISAAGQSVSARFGVIENSLSDYPKITRNNFIDDYIFAKLRKFNIVPSELSSDSEFLRRVCLDLAGRVPPPERVRRFLTSKDPKKREEVIDALLRSPQYVDYWTFRFADLFRVASYANGFSLKQSRSYWRWIHDSIAQNKPYDQIARERLTAEGVRGPTAHYRGVLLPAGPGNIMAEEVRVFLGRRLDCAQCHNHPFEAWSQDQFWGMAAFFGQMTEIGGVIVDQPGGYGEKGAGGPVIHPRTKAQVVPTFLDGKIVPVAQRSDPREALAQWTTSNPYFAEAAVNRMWGYFFGHGIVDPVDDFRSTNPPTHPELLQALARDFREHRYDLKYLVRLIVTSRTYQLSSAPNETNKDDKINYSHALARPLDAEVLLDSITDVSGVPEVFDLQATVSGAKGREPIGTRAIQLKETDVYPSRFLDFHGRPDRMAVPERDAKANLAQALHLLAGSTYTEKLHKEGNRIDHLLKNGDSNQAIIEELSLTGLSRFPTKEEIAGFDQLIRKSADRRKAIEDLMWGLINTEEFIYNH